MMDFGRVITAMLTPMHATGAVDYDGAKQLAAHLLAHGSDALVITGTTGESPTLRTEEKLALYAAVREVAGPKQLIAGTTGNDTAASIELSKKAEALGVDAILAVVPAYNKPPQEGLYQHFRAIAEAVCLPVILYNVPSRTGIELEPDTLCRLAQIENIIALKQASTDLGQFNALYAAVPADFAIYSGDDAVALPMCAAGSCGVVSVASHLIGNELQEMLLAQEKGDTARAAALHQRCLPIFRALFCAANPIPLKYACGKMGLPAGPCRLPLVPPSDTQKACIDQAMHEFGLF